MPPKLPKIRRLKIAHEASRRPKRAPRWPDRASRRLQMPRSRPTSATRGPLGRPDEGSPIMFFMASTFSLESSSGGPSWIPPGAKYLPPTNFPKPSKNHNFRTSCGSLQPSWGAAGGLFACLEPIFRAAHNGDAASPFETYGREPGHPNKSYKILPRGPARTRHWNPLSVADNKPLGR